jgi:hypothetical protein
VFVDGHEAFTHPSESFQRTLHAAPKAPNPEPISLQSAYPNIVSLDTCTNTETKVHGSYALKNIGRIFLGPGQVVEGGSSIHVQNGIISCIGRMCTSSATIEVDMKGAEIIPVRYFTVFYHIILNSWDYVRVV